MLISKYENVSNYKLVDNIKLERTVVDKKYICTPYVIIIGNKSGQN